MANVVLVVLLYIPIPNTIRPLVRFQVTLCRPHVTAPKGCIDPAAVSDRVRAKLTSNHLAGPRFIF